MTICQKHFPPQIHQNVWSTMHYEICVAVCKYQEKLKEACLHGLLELPPVAMRKKKKEFVVSEFYPNAALGFKNLCWLSCHIWLQSDFCVLLLSSQKLSTKDFPQ